MLTVSSEKKIPTKKKRIEKRKRGRQREMKKEVEDEKHPQNVIESAWRTLTS